MWVLVEIEGVHARAQFPHMMGENVGKLTPPGLDILFTITLFICIAVITGFSWFFFIFILSRLPLYV